MLAQLSDARSMQSGGSGAKFSAWISAKVVDPHMSQIHLIERHREPIAHWFGMVVHKVDEDAHPLLPSAVRVHGPAFFARRLDLDAFGARLDAIVRINAFHNQIRMSVEVPVFGEPPGVFGQTRRQQVREYGNAARRLNQSASTLFLDCFDNSSAPASWSGRHDRTANVR